MIQKTPYVKNYVDGILTNPITAANPYLFAPHPYFLKIQNKPSEFKRKVWNVVRNRYFKGLTVVIQ